MFLQCIGMSTLQSRVIHYLASVVYIKFLPAFGYCHCGFVDCIQVRTTQHVYQLSGSGSVVFTLL